MDIIFEPGKLLFHGTSEEFPVKEIRGGGYDGVIWTAETPDIAQNYIPISGVTTAISARYLTRPQKGSVIQQLQRKIGIEYDYSTVEWDYMDRATSFYYPKGWDRLPEEVEVVERLENLGYEKESYGMYKIRMTYLIDGAERLMLPGEKTIGRLFIFKVKQPLRIFDFTLGGDREGDLMNVDYVKFGGKFK